MSEVRDCPRCGLVNPPAAARCDCGYDFVARQFAGSLLPPGRPGDGTFGLGSALLLGAAVGGVVGATVGVPLQIWATGPGSGPDACGLMFMPAMIDGLVRGAFAGGLVGAGVTAVLTRRRRLLGLPGGAVSR